jgi:hypothetical protein
VLLHRNLSSCKLHSRLLQIAGNMWRLNWFDDTVCNGCGEQLCSQIGGVSPYHKTDIGRDWRAVQRQKMQSLE